MTTVDEAPAVDVGQPDDAGLLEELAAALARVSSGDFKARQIARAGRRRVVPHALRNVGAIDAGCQDLDQDLVRTGFWDRARFRQEHLGTTGPADADHGHLRGQLLHGLSLP